MIKLYSKIDFKQSKSRQLLPFKCIQCKKIFLKPKNYIQAVLRGNNRMTLEFCSKNCHNKSKELKISLICNFCQKRFERIPSQCTQSKNHFCSQSCSAKYNNTHKRFRIRRSKLEEWLQNQLTKLYPDLEIHYNQKDAIESELDIYIPSLKLAFELNGIFHYEPIFGKNKLNQIQNMDQLKFKACQEKEISLCIIDSSKLKYFKEQRCFPYLQIITKIINQSF